MRRQPNRVLFTTTMLMAPFATNALHAQEAPASAADDAEEVVITGLASVDIPAETLKREKTGIVDSQTAEQIERTPDVSLAEVLDRVVGVSSDRGYNSSEGRTVTIRGFDARYNSMDVDGNPVWNSSRNNRGTQLDVFPASVIHQANVYKTVTPDMDANSIGGHLEMRTLRAFDGGTQPYFKASMALGTYDQNGVPENDGPSYRVSVVGKRTFGSDDQFGFVIGGDVRRDKWVDSVKEVSAYSQLSGIDVPNGSSWYGLYDKDTRNHAAYAKLEARSIDKFYAFVSANYFQQESEATYYRANTFFTAPNVTGAVQGAGDFTRGTAESFIEDYNMNRSTLLLAGGLDYRFGVRSLLTLRGSFTDYDHQEDLFRGERFQFSSLTGSYDIGRDDPGIAITSPTIGNPATWVHRNNRDAFRLFRPMQDHVYSLRADFEHNSYRDARGLGVRMGGSWRRLKRDFDQRQENYRPLTGRTIPYASVLRPGQTINGVDPVFIDGTAYWAWMQANSRLTIDDAATTDYRLTEDVLDGHGALTFATGGLKLLAGVRVEKTRYTNDSADTVGGVTRPATRRFDYTEVMPNVQASYEVTPDLLIRAAYTETLGRPDFADFAMGQTVTYDGNGNPIIRGTNPYLRPRTAQNWDASIDYYFRGGFASVAVFHKKLDDETFVERRQTLGSDGVPVLTEETPLNTGDARVRGIEASVVVDRFAFLPAPFDGLGFSANYARLDGEWAVVFTDGSTRSVGGLRNQPKWLGNLSIDYRTGPVELNLAWRLRGRTFTGTFGTTQTSDIWVDDYGKLDLQVRVKVAKGFELFGMARNLTDAVWVEQTGLATDTLSAAYRPGRSYFAGVRIKQ